MDLDIVTSKIIGFLNLREIAKLRLSNTVLNRIPLISNIEFLPTRVRILISDFVLELEEEDCSELASASTLCLRTWKSSTWNYIRYA